MILKILGYVLASWGSVLVLIGAALTALMAQAPAGTYYYNKAFRHPGIVTALIGAGSAALGAVLILYL